MNNEPNKQTEEQRQHTNINKEASSAGSVPKEIKTPELSAPIQKQEIREVKDTNGLPKVYSTKVPFYDGRGRKKNIGGRKFLKGLRTFKGDGDTEFDFFICTKQREAQNWYALARGIDLKLARRTDKSTGAITCYVVDPNN